jgi:hypothetical protein
VISIGLEQSGHLPTQVTRVETDKPAAQ